MVAYTSLMLLLAKGPKSSSRMTFAWAHTAVRSTGTARLESVVIMKGGGLIKDLVSLQYFLPGASLYHDANAKARAYFGGLLSRFT